MIETHDHNVNGAVHIHNAIDAGSDNKRRVSLRIENGLIADIRAADQDSNDAPSDAKDTSDDVTIDASGLHISPGFIDSYARLRDPGYEKKSTIASEVRAAALNGITTILCSPDTDPVIDEAATVELINRKARDSAQAKVLPIAALTRGLGGELLSELATLKAAGCIAASNADAPIVDLQVIRRCMEYARTFDIVLILHPADSWLSANGCAHEGATATRAGLPTIPVAAETIALAILIELVWQTGARVHFSRITSRRGVEMIRQARRGGLQVTADTSINHLVFDDTMLGNFDSQFHSIAPFRDIDDRDALREAVIDGTIDSICTDHAPHERDAKLAPFPSSEPGISGLDTLLGHILTLQETADMPLSALLAAVTRRPAEIFDLAQGKFETGAPADIILFDADSTYTVDPGSFLSAGRNTPLEGKTLCGKVVHTLIDGKLIDRFETD